MTHIGIKSAQSPSVAENLQDYEESLQRRYAPSPSDNKKAIQSSPLQIGAFPVGKSQAQIISEIAGQKALMLLNIVTNTISNDVELNAVKALHDSTEDVVYETLKCLAQVFVSFKVPELDEKVRAICTRLITHKQNLEVGTNRIECSISQREIFMDGIPAGSVDPAIHAINAASIRYFMTNLLNGTVTPNDVNLVDYCLGSVKIRSVYSLKEYIEMLAKPNALEAITGMISNLEDSVIKKSLLLMSTEVNAFNFATNLKNEIESGKEIKNLPQWEEGIKAFPQECSYVIKEVFKVMGTESIEDFLIHLRRSDTIVVEIDDDPMNGDSCDSTGMSQQSMYPTLDNFISSIAKSSEMKEHRRSTSANSLETVISPPEVSVSQSESIATSLESAHSSRPTSSASFQEDK